MRVFPIDRDHTDTLQQPIERKIVDDFFAGVIPEHHMAQAFGNVLRVDAALLHRDIDFVLGLVNRDQVIGLEKHPHQIRHQPVDGILQCVGANLAAAFDFIAILAGEKPLQRFALFLGKL